MALNKLNINPDIRLPISDINESITGDTAVYIRTDERLLLYLLDFLIPEEEKAFLISIQKNPYDITLRGIASDYLKDNNRYISAALIRNTSFNPLERSGEVN